MSQTELDGKRSEHADFDLTVTDDSLLPWVHEGERIRVQRNTELFDGEVGLFETDAGLAFRQFCSDSRGAVYLFAVNRSYAALDCVLSPEKADDLICYGRAALSMHIPLPTD